MIVYGQLIRKADFTDYQQLAEKLWFDNKDGKEVEFSHVYQEETYTFQVSLDRWLNHDEGWEPINAELDREWLYSSVTTVKTFDELQFKTSHVEVLTADKRAFYILVVERMRLADGLISEDNRQTWITVEEFEARHQDVLSLSYDEANVMSLEEVKTMETVKERPTEWDTEEEKKNLEEFWEEIEDDEIKEMREEIKELRAFKERVESQTHNNIYLDTKAKIQKALKQIREMNQTIDSEWKGYAFKDYLKQYEELESKMLAFSSLLDEGDNLLREYEQENRSIRSNILDITNAVIASVHDTKSLVDSTEAKRQMDELSKSGVATIANAGDVKSILNTDKSIKDFGSQSCGNGKI
ncbi:MAG: hypothetical protein LBI13_00770 [Streptococcaceae bacterium]|jgi:uncharacterized protein YukE|nr:hypothetical protein [Streptococcaceae bacterium]